MEKKTFNFQDFSDYCPLCTGKDCSVKIGFYNRKSITIHCYIYHGINIQRFECRGLGPKKPAHRTFSLLPHLAVPYRQYDQEAALDTAICNTRATIEDTKSHMIEKHDISLEYCQINDIDVMMNEAFFKLTSIDKLNNIIENSGYFNYSDPVKTVVHFASNYRSLLSPSLLTSLEQLSVDYFYHYQQEQSWFDRHFLFGTPSQKRNKST
jgi:hypothetical protein